MNDSSEQSKTIEKEIEEGKKRDDILCSFKGIGVCKVCYCLLSLRFNNLIHLQNFMFNWLFCL